MQLIPPPSEKGSIPATLSREQALQTLQSPDSTEAPSQMQVLIEQYSIPLFIGTPITNERFALMGGRFVVKQLVIPSRKCNFGNITIIDRLTRIGGCPGKQGCTAVNLRSSTLIVQTLLAIWFRNQKNVALPCSKFGCAFMNAALPVSSNVITFQIIQVCDQDCRATLSMPLFMIFHNYQCLLVPPGLRVGGLS